MALDQPTATLIAGIAAAAGSTVVGVAAVFFAWRNTKTTLRQQRTMATDERLWEEQRKVYQDLAEWLAAHPVAGSPDPLYELNVFSAWTSDPGQEIEGKARLYALEPVVAAVRRVRAIAYEENTIAKLARTAMENVTTHGRSFAESSASGVFDWKGPADAHQQLKPLRESWTNARDTLERTIRDVYREDRGHPPASGD